MEPHCLQGGGNRHEDDGIKILAQLLMEKLGGGLDITEIASV